MLKIELFNFFPSNYQIKIYHYISDNSFTYVDFPSKFFFQSVWSKFRPDLKCEIHRYLKAENFLFINKPISEFFFYFSYIFLELFKK